MPRNPNSTKQARSKSRVSDKSQPAENLDGKFMSLARQRWHISDEAETSIRKDSLEDIEFSLGKQWSEEIRLQRTLDKRPCMTINRFPQFIRFVTNDQRQQRPSIKVSPRGAGATKKTAEILEGIIRNITSNSDYDVAIDTAFDFMVRGGFGYFRIVTQYADDSDDSTEQEIRIEWIENPFSVYFSPCKTLDYSDAKWCFIVYDYLPEDYKAEFGDESFASLTEFKSTGNSMPGWVTKEYVRVAEYFYVEEEKVDRVLTETGWDDAKNVKNKKGLPIKTRMKRTVKWSKINALGPIEGGPENEIVWNGTYIPVIPVLGDSVNVDGKRHVSGLVRHAKEPQKQYNFMCSAATEAIGLAPKAPWLVLEGQIEGYEKQWEQSNLRSFAYLTYKGKDLQGKPAGPPARNAVEPPIEAMMRMVQQADNDLKSTVGIYDASLGKSGPEESGKAILARQRQGGLATLNFSDNLVRAVTYLGKQLIDLIPKVMDTTQVQRITYPDQTHKMVGTFNSTNGGVTQEQAQQMLQEQVQQQIIQKIYDIGVGKYDVSVSTGPSYQTKRQEAVESILSLVNAYPALMQLAGDILVGNMDWNGAEEIANRLKQTLPPNIQIGNDDQDPKIINAQLQIKLNTLMQQHSMAVQELQKAMEMIRTKKMDIESKERVANLQAKVNLITTEAKIQGEAALIKLQKELEAVERREELLNSSLTIDQDMSGGGQPQPPVAAPGGQQSIPQQVPPQIPPQAAPPMAGGPMPPPPGAAGPGGGQSLAGLAGPPGPS